MLLRIWKFVRPSWRSVGVLCFAVLGTAWFCSRVTDRYASSEWLVWDLAKLWCWSTVLSVSAVSCGLWLLQRMDPDARPPLERLALAFPLGFVVFGFGFHLLGLAGLFRVWVAVLWPCVLAAVGAPTLLRACDEWRHAKAKDAKPWPLPALSLLMLGACAVGLLYLGALSPEAVNYDASWTHLAVAEDYARKGRVVAFPGNWVKNLPHLGSVVYTWAFLLPGFDVPPQRWMMALHVEFVCFVWTLVMVAAAIDWVCGRRVPMGWAAFFLFPGVFVYDSNMGGAADHLLAMLVAPMPLLGAAALRRFDWKATTLLGLVAGGALTTKLQAAYVVMPLALMGAARFAWLAVRSPERGRFAALAMGTFAFGLATSAVLAPHAISTR